MSTLDDLLEGVKRKASLGDLGESTADFLSEDKNTFGRKDAPEGIPAHYIDSDKEGNTYAGRSVGQSASRDPYEEAKKRSPVATGIGDMLGSGAAQVPAFVASSGMSLPARLMRNFAVPAAEHAISDEQGGLGDKLKGTAKWMGEHPMQQAVNTLLPEALPTVLKGAKAGIGKLLGRAPSGEATPRGPGGGDLDVGEMDAIMQDIADYERTHGVQETPEAKAALVAKIMKKRRPDLIPVGEPLSSEPAANGNRTIAANNNSDPRAAPKRAVGDNDEDDLMK
jgi:hypothetical protein